MSNKEKNNNTKVSGKTIAVRIFCAFLAFLMVASGLYLTISLIVGLF